MIKRALAATLCLMLVFALLPKTARAAENYTMDFSQTGEVGWNGKPVNYSTDDDNGTGWSWDASEKKLTLSGLNFETNAAIALKLPAGTTLVLNGTNTVTSSPATTSSVSSNAIRVINGGDLSIQGTGTLTATGGTSSAKGSTGINVGGNLTISGGSVTGKGGTSGNASSFGVYVSKKLTVSNGTLTGEGGHATATDGDSCGVHADGEIEALENGTIKGKGGTSEKASSIGVEAAHGSNITVNPRGSITGEGGVSKDTSAGQSYGVKAENNITVEENGYLQGKAQTAPNGSFGIAASDTLTLKQNATTLAQGHMQALGGTLDLKGGTAVASENYDGSGAGSYVSANNDKYKYFRMSAAVQATQITVTQDTFPFGQAPVNETVTVTSNAATFNFNASNSFDRATMDGGPIDVGSVGTPGAQGSVRNGSILIQLNKAYLDTLPVGTHTLRVYLTGVYIGQYVETTITVLPSGGGIGAGGDVGPDVPQTGDAATPALWLGLMLLAGAGLIVRRKRRNG